MRRFVALTLGMALLLSPCAGVARAGQARTPAVGSDRDALSQYPELTTTQLVRAKALFWKLAEGFTAGDSDGLKKLFEIIEERERIGRALEQEFKQSRYIEFSIVDVVADDAFNNRRYAVDVRIRYKLTNRGNKVLTPAGQALEFSHSELDAEDAVAGPWLEIPIHTSTLEKYDVLLSTADIHEWEPPRKMSPFSWSIDGGVAQKGPVFDGVRDEDYLYLGSVDLKEGNHVFRLQLSAGSEGPDAQYAFWLNALILRKKSGGPERDRAALVFEAAPALVRSSGWVVTPYIENCTTQTFVIQKLADGSFMLVGSEFFDSLGLRQGLGVVLVNVILAAMTGCALLVFWVWMGYESSCARPRYRAWRFVVFIPVAGPFVFFFVGYIPRLIRRLGPVK